MSDTCNTDIAKSEGGSKDKFTSPIMQNAKLI